MRRTNAWCQPLVTRLRKSWPADASSRPKNLCEVELGLYLLGVVAASEPARSLPALLTGYQLPLHDGGWTTQRRRCVGIARQLLLHFKSLPAWRHALDEYRALPQWLRGYDVDSNHNGHQRREVTPARERWDIYAKALASVVPHRTDSLRPAGPGTYLAVAGRSRATVTIPDDLPLPGFPTGHTLNAAATARAPLEVSWDALIETARWMDAQEAADPVPSPSGWERRLTRELWVYNDSTASYERSQHLRVDRQLHMVGMVSSGKSTLMDVLAVWAARSGRRVTLVVGDVVTAVRRTNAFRALGLSAVPILGYSNRRRHVERLHRVLLGETRASPLEHADPGFDFLSTACALDGLRRAAKPFRLGDSPCDHLHPKDPLQDLGAIDSEDLEEVTTENGKLEQAVLGCPFYAVCQQQQAARELVTAPIWVATPASLVYTRVPTQVNRERLHYAELVYRLSDLVVVDEADQVQVQLDATFCPNETLLGGRRESWFEDLNERVTRELRHRGRAQMREPGVAEWVAAFDAGWTAGNRLYGLLNREPALRAWVERNYFTEWSLFQELAREWASVGGREDPRDNPVYQRLVADFDSYLARRFTEEDGAKAGNTTHPLAEVTSQLLYGDDATLGRAAVRRWLDGQRSSGDLNLPDGRVDTSVLRLEFVLLLAALAGRLNYLLRHWRAVEDPLNLDSGGLLFHKPPEEYGSLLPEAPMGNQLGFQYRHPSDAPDNGEMGALRFFRAMGVGRWLLLHLHELFAFDGVAGPNVLLLSGTSWAGASPSYHVDERVGAVLMAPSAEIDAIRKSRFSFDYLTGLDDQPLSVSGKHGEPRRAAIRGMLARLVAPAGPRGGPSRLERELQELPAGRQRVLLLVGSYQEALKAHIDLLELRPEWREQVLHLEADDAVEFGTGWRSVEGLRRGEVERFARTGARFLIAPLLAMERGHNILNEENAAAIGSVYFLVRPHPHPEDISFAVHSINRWAIEHPQGLHDDPPTSTLVDRSQRFRGQAYGRWRQLLGVPLIYSSLDQSTRKAIAWSQLVSIWQVIGRLVRGGHPARVHFCDARFAERTARHEGPDTPQTSLLLGMREVLTPFFEPHTAGIRSQDQAVVHILYEPLYQALTRIEGVASAPGV
jgi:hypothetical protein